MSYNYYQYEVKDAADALTFLEERLENGYEYVEGLPHFLVGGQAPAGVAGIIVSVLFKKRLSP